MDKHIPLRGIEMQQEMGRKYKEMYTRPERWLALPHLTRHIVTTCQGQVGSLQEGGMH